VIAILAIIISFFLPWYFVKYNYTNNGSYTSSAYIHPWYIYENVGCSLQNCTGHPGALFSDEGLNLWIIGIDDGRFGMRLIFLISWGLITADIFVLLISLIRSNKGKIVAYIAFMIALIATAFFYLLPTSFTPCTMQRLRPETGPCHSFVGHSQYPGYGEYTWGPYAGWITTFIAACFTGFALFLAIISPKPYYSNIEDEEEEQRLKDHFWK
jgi:hypothetical protein